MINREKVKVLLDNLGFAGVCLVRLLSKLGVVSIHTLQFILRYHYHLVVVTESECISLNISLLSANSIDNLK